MSVEDKHQEKISAASDLKRFLQSMKSVPDYQHRVQAAHAQVTTTVDAICRDGECDCFDDEQIRVLTALIMHVVVMNEPSLQQNPGFFPGLRREFQKASGWGKIGYVAILVTVIAGVLTIGDMAQKSISPLFSQEVSAATPSPNLDPPEKIATTK